MNIITPKNLSGFMELVPKEQVLFEKIKQKLGGDLPSVRFLSD